MPIQYMFDKELSIIIATAIGRVAIEDRAAFVDKILRDTSMPETAPLLIDVSAIENAPEMNDAHRMKILMQMLISRFKRKVAYWVTAVGMVTPFSLVTFASSLGRDDVRTFTSRDEAIRWLCEP